MEEKKLAILVCSSKQGKLIGIVSKIGKRNDFTVDPTAQKL